MPPTARSPTLIVDDPDAPDPAAPQRTRVHSVVIDLPPSATGLPQGGKRLPVGAREGLNDWHRAGYAGPCPPVGRHRYFFKRYARDTWLPGLRQPTKAQVEHAMSGHIVAQAEPVGTYQKTQR